MRGMGGGEGEVGKEGEEKEKRTLKIKNSSSHLRH
jgi:hypothetical protein